MSMSMSRNRSSVSARWSNKASCIRVVLHCVCARALVCLSGVHVAGPAVRTP